MAFLSHVSSEEAQKRLESMFLDECMPLETALHNIGKAIRCSKQVMESELFNFACAGAQGSIKAADQMLHLIEQGMPVSASPGQTTFLQDVWRRTQFFVVYCGGDTPQFDEDGLFVKPQHGKFLSGKSALMEMWNVVSKKSPDDMSLPELEPFITFGSLLEESQSKQAREWAELLVTKVPRASKKRKGLSEKATAKSKAAAKRPDAEQAAQSLFAA